MIEHLKLLGLGINIGNNIKICILMYADDIILLANTEAELQSLLLALETWCKQWQLSVNIDKTNILHFRNRQNPQTLFKFIYNQNELLKVSNYKYQGFFLHEHLDFEFNALKLSKSASRAIGSLLSKFKLLKNVSFNAYTKSYNALVTSILDYSSEIWGHIKAPSIDKIQHRAVRFFLGVHKFCPIAAMSGDIGWLRSKDRRKICMIRFWNRLINMRDSRLTKQVFLADFNQNSNNWCSEIEQIFDSVNCLTIFQERHTCDLLSFESKLKFNLQNEWHNEINKKPKLRTYVHFKDIFKTENYVSSRLAKAHYCAMLGIFLL